jgi:RHS repeat-associated protein
MQGISSKALSFGSPENRYKFNGIEKLDDLGLEMYDAQFREHDPQIGRWWQIDPKADEENFESWSPYNNNYDNPISYFDYLGDAPDGWPPKWMRDAGNWIADKATQAGNWVKDNAHEVLDAVGTIDPTGIADGLNAVIYLAEGDYKNAAISGLSILPGGDLAKGGKYIDKGVDAVKALDNTKSIVKTGEKANDLSKGSKLVPNPNGKNGGPAHQGKIDAAEKKLQKQGYETKREVKVSTPSGSTKNNRYVDVVGTKNGKTVYVNVGKNTKGGKPVSRERKALDDIKKSPDRQPDSKVVFIPYN